MRIVVLAGLMTSALSLSMPPAMAQQQPDAPAATASGGEPVTPHGRWGPRVNGRWQAGDQAPGGWSAYRTPVAGFILPGYWSRPAYHIADYDAYGLPAPPPGHGWSRYYDDAVMTDQYGKVRDSRIGYDWDRYDDQDYASVDAGQVAGAANDDLMGVDRHAVGDDLTGDAYFDQGDRARLNADRRVAREAARQQRDRINQRRKLDRLAQEAGYSDYEHYVQVRDGGRAPVEPQAPDPRYEVSQTGGYVAGDYYYPGPTVTTITLEPTVTTTTTTSYVTEPAAPR